MTDIITINENIPRENMSKENVKDNTLKNNGQLSPSHKRLEKINNSFKEFNFPAFEDIKVSTKTIIIVSNLVLDIEKLFDFLPFVYYKVIEKKRGRKKKTDVPEIPMEVPSGSIVSIKYRDEVRGVNMKKKKKTVNNKKRSDYFRNSVTVEMMIDNKKINYKVSRNGKFQMTGCKNDDNADKCVKFFWEYIKDNPELYKFQNPDDKTFKIVFDPAMRNIDFDLNFLVDREKLDEYFNTHTQYHSLLETSFGYTGVNIKFPVVKPLTDLNLMSYTWSDGTWSECKYITYMEYISMLPEKEGLKKLNKQRYTTFLVFHSGKVIMSGMEETFMKDVYYDFLKIINDCYELIREKLIYKEKNIELR